MGSSNSSAAKIDGELECESWSGTGTFKSKEVKNFLNSLPYGVVANILDQRPLFSDYTVDLCTMKVIKRHTYVHVTSINYQTLCQIFGFNELDQIIVSNVHREFFATCKRLKSKDEKKIHMSMTSELFKKSDKLWTLSIKQLREQLNSLPLEKVSPLLDIIPVRANYSFTRVLPKIIDRWTDKTGKNSSHLSRHLRIENLEDHDLIWVNQEQKKMIEDLLTTAAATTATISTTDVEIVPVKGKDRTYCL